LIPGVRKASQGSCFSANRTNASNYMNAFGF
jgi:hypothetical protein